MNRKFNHCIERMQNEQNTAKISHFRCSGVLDIIALVISVIGHIGCLILVGMATEKRRENGKHYCSAQVWVVLVIRQR